MKLIWIWLTAMVVLGIVEALTVSLVCIWFVGGALAAAIAALLGAPVWVQLAAFIIVSVGLLLALRPFVQKSIRSDGTATNVDSNIGKTAVVIEKIDNLHGTGHVMIDRVDWTARSEDGSVIEVGETVQVLRIEGVKVCVQRVPVGAKI